MLLPIDSSPPHLHALHLWSVIGFAVLTLAAFLLGRRSPMLTLVLLLVADPFDGARAVGGTTITAEKCALAGVLAALFATRRLRVPSRHAVWFFAFFALLVATTALSAIHAGARTAVLREILKYVEYGLLAWCGAAIAARSSSAAVERAFVAATSVVLLMVALLAIAQAVVGGAPSGIWVDNLAIPRVAGPLEGPNQLSGYLEVTLPVLLLAAPSSGIIALVRGGAIGASYAALILTQSRMGIAMVLGETLWALRTVRLQLGSLRTAIASGALVGLLIVACWYVAAFAPLLKGASSRVVVAQPSATDALSATATPTTTAPPATTTARTGARAGAALEADPRVAFVKPNDPIRIIASSVHSRAVSGGNELTIELITTSNAAAATLRLGTTVWNLPRPAFGVFAGSVFVSYAMDPGAQLLLEATAIRTDSRRTSKEIAVPVAFDPKDVHVETYAGIGGLSRIAVARAFNPHDLQDPGAVGTRHALWHAAFLLFRSHPLTGIGAANYELDLASVGLPGIRTNANSYYLQTLAEQGAAGFLALVLLIAGLLWSLAGAARTPLAAAALIATVALFAHQTLDTLLFYPKIAGAYWLLVGAALGTPRRDEVRD